MQLTTSNANMVSSSSSSSSSSAIYAVSPLYAELASRSRSSTIAESFLYTFIVCVGTVGNFAVLLVLYKNRRLRNIPAYFVISLAISDIIMLNLCAPFSIGVLLSLIHISEPTRPLYISYAVFCLKKKSILRSVSVCSSQ